MSRGSAYLVLGLLLATSLAGCSGSSLDGELEDIVVDQRLVPLSPVEAAAPELTELGEALFFDKILSGNRDTACATCHHPLEAGGDGLSVSIGTKGVGLGSDRVLGADRDLVARNAPDLFNRGADGWFTMFWDSRVAGTAEHGFSSPAGDALPDGLDSVLAVQALFPPTSPVEMLGLPGDVSANGQLNEIASETSVEAIWDLIVNRVLDIDEYRSMFSAAFPDIAVDEIGIEHIGNAIAAYEASAFLFADSPWDRYLAGEIDALNADAKRGAILFYGEAGCGGCHTGALLTDQLTHNVAPPQVGPGIDDDGSDDFGREGVSGNYSDRYGFRTPPLRNVELTGPWLHDGAYLDLESAIRHFLDPASALAAYDPSPLRDEVTEFYLVDEARIDQAITLMDPRLRVPKELTDEEIDQVEAFLVSLTDPAAKDLGHMVPDSVPSGLPVDGS
ncbi:MAG: cytochrome-c peroxidase [bacterium]|nr:cytochrome-c peroxidase [bacterium]